MLKKNVFIVISLIGAINLHATLDTTFNPLGPLPGTVATQFPDAIFDGSNSVNIQSDGKIVAAGITYDGINTFGLARYNIDGAIDTSFGINGFVRTPFYGDTFSFISDSKMQKDGKIVAAGTATINENILFALARYNTNGSLDTTGFNPLGGAAAGTV